MTPMALLWTTRVLTLWHYIIHYSIHYAIPSSNSITQFHYANILKIMLLRNGGNYAEIHKNYAMDNLLIGS